jgi:hypothetical protein
MAKIHVWYKTSGQIVAVGRASEKGNVVPVTGENQSVLETDIEESQIASLHQTHMVDPRRQVVVKRKST